MSSQTSLDGSEWGEPEEPEETVLDRAGEGAAYDGFSAPRTNGQRATSSLNNECQYCGAHVSDEFVRVLGVDGQVHVCPRCSADQPNRTRQDDSSEQARGALTRDNRVVHR